MELISGTRRAEEIRNSLREKNRQEGIQPHLAVLLVGDNPESAVYVRLKEKAVESIYGLSTVVRLNADINREELLSEINKLNNDKNIDGIILQLPLPQHLADGQDDFLEAIRIDKDVDGFNPINRGKLIGGKPCFVSCAALACLDVINNYIDYSGKNALLVGDSFDLIIPLAVLLIKQGVNVEVISQYDPQRVKNADIIIIEKGEAGIVKGEDLHNGILLLDAGFHWQNGTTLGNVANESTADVSGYLLPVPGGLGPLLIAELMKNLSDAAFFNRRS